MTKNNETSMVTADDAFTADMQAIMGEFGGGALDSLTTGDVVMPRYKLIQNTSRTGTPGKWISNTAPDEELDELNIIILDISSYRVMFPAQGQGDRPLCRSNDGMSKSDMNGVGDVLVLIAVIVFGLKTRIPAGISNPNVPVVIHCLA